LVSSLVTALPSLPYADEKHSTVILARDRSIHRPLQFNKRGEAGVGDGDRKFWLEYGKTWKLVFARSTVVFRAESSTGRFLSVKKNIPEHISPSLLASIFHLLINYLNGF